MKRIALVSFVCFVFTLMACSMDQAGVKSDQQRPCPECPECDVCPTDQPDDPCNGVSYEGQCTEDGVVQWCEDGVLLEIDCAGDGNVCGYDEELQFFDCLPGSDDDPDPESGNSAMEFTCTCDNILMDVQFELGEDGCIKGVLGYVKPEQVVKVKFFVDGTDIATAPSADYNVEGNSAVLELPGCSVTGNLFLELRDDTTAWADVGHFDLTGASVSENYLTASCGQGSECYCQ